MTIAQWLQHAHETLTDAKIPSSRLDGEIILSHTIRKGRTYLHAHPDEELPLRMKDIADARLELRLDRTPLAYIVGHKEFYARSFRVTPATLIPRPESEDMITMLKSAVGQGRLPLGDAPLRLVDVGTGSGCLGISAKLELPELDVTLCDTSRHALTVAEMNAKQLKAHVQILRGDLLQNYAFQADYILANLPYVDPSWEISPELTHEPEEALFAHAGGLGTIFRLLDEAPDRIARNGLLFIEADPRQHEMLEKYAKTRFSLQTQSGFILCFRPK